MIARRSVQLALTILALLSLCPVGPALLRAQDSSQPDVENSKFQITGVVNANAVFVRSGPSENDYATAKIEKGTKVIVVGERFNWLKVVPPDGSFCYVGKAWVNRAGNGSIGQVTGSSLYVRIGSDLNQLKTKIATKLEPGQRVEIIGEQDEYYKIKPPAGVCLYISKQFVDPVGQVQVNATKPDEPKQAEPGQDAVASGPTTNPSGAGGDPTTSNNSTQSTGGQTSRIEKTGAPPTTQGSDPTPPTTQAIASAEAEFERLEAEYAKIAQKPIEEQPVEELLEGYKKLSAGDGLSESIRRICDFKAGVLQNRAELKKDVIGTRKIQETLKEKQAALKGEQKDLEDLVKRTQVQIYTGVGMLRTSSLQQGQQPLFRLTDPANGRTVVYVRDADNKLGQMVGQFIGVRGQVEADAQLGLKIISPTGYDVVNPAKIGQSVAAQFVPPSLLPGRGGTANVNEP